MKAIVVIAVVVCVSFGCAASKHETSGTATWSVKVADSFLKTHPEAAMVDSVNTGTKWNYEQGIMLVALGRLWKATNDTRYREFITKNIDSFVDSVGTISTYKQGDYRLDDIGPGRALFMLSTVTGAAKYAIAAERLHQQLVSQPRTAEGRFWHKKIYPNQMWLDGMFMAEPFNAEHVAMNPTAAGWDDIANQILLMDKHMRDSATGLYYHGWDESKKERWANPATGCSPTFWGRAMGWYAMGIIDVLDNFPADHSKRKAIVEILKNLCAALKRYQDPKSHLWYQVVDQGGREGNYLESSSSSMFTYVFAKGARMGYLTSEYRETAKTAFASLTERMVTTAPDGTVILNGICPGVGLGGKPYRDGSYDYYCSERPHANDLKGLGAFLLAAIELEYEVR